MTPRDDDVRILGAGVIGLSCALELLKAGRGVAPARSGCDGKPSHCSGRLRQVDLGFEADCTAVATAGVGLAPAIVLRRERCVRPR